MATEAAPFDPYESIRYIPARYNNQDSDNSALGLILALRPEWRETKDSIELVRFTDGITNTVRMPGTASERDQGKRGSVSLTVCG